MVLRKEKNTATKVLFDNDLMQSLDVVHPIDETDSVAEGYEQALTTCIADLSAEQQRCIKLFYYQEKSYKEIVGITGHELSKVRSFIQNGRRNLKICIDKKTAANEE